MRVVLINPPDELAQVLGAGHEFIQKYEPLGILYIAAVLLEANHDVTVIDAHAENLDGKQIITRLEGYLPQTEESTNQWKHIPQMVVGFSTLTCNGAQVYHLGQEIKSRMPQVKVILGNVHASVFAKQYLENGCCDAVVHGDGEYTTLELIEKFELGQSISDVPGISIINDEGKVTRNKPDGYIRDISTLPMPARHLVNQDLYQLSSISNQPYVPGKSEISKTLITSRGCPQRCTFCAVHRGLKPRYNTAIRVVDELEHLEKEYGATYVYFQDPLFVGDRQRILDICDEYTRRGLTIRWGAEAHVNYIDKELIQGMEKAGCFDLSLGLESGSQQILNSIRKGFRIDQAIETIDIIKKSSKIKLSGLFILGLPGETHEDIMTTINYARSLPLDIAQFSIFTPYPGSPLFEQLAAQGEIDTGIRPGGKLDPSVWARYAQYILFEDIDPIWVPEGMTFDQIRAYQKLAMRKFYLRPKQIIRHVKRLRPNNIMKAAKIALDGFF